MLFIGPVFMIRRLPEFLFIHWQENLIYIFAIAGSGISAILGFTLSSGVKELKRQRLTVWGAVVVTFLYVACMALCESISFGVYDQQWFRDLGVVIVVLGGGLRLWAIFTLGKFHSGFVALQKDHRIICHGPYKLIRHPSYLGFLLILIGLPLVFGTWLPLLAIPGFVIAMKWRLEDEEEFLVNELGQDYRTYRQNTWRMIPGLY